MEIVRQHRKSAKMRLLEAQIWPEFEMFVFSEISVLMSPTLDARQIFLERIDRHETDTIRQIRACSFGKNSESQN